MTHSASAEPAKPPGVLLAYDQESMAFAQACRDLATDMPITQLPHEGQPRHLAAAECSAIVYCGNLRNIATARAIRAHVDAVAGTYQLYFALTRIDHWARTQAFAFGATAVHPVTCSEDLRALITQLRHGNAAESATISSGQFHGIFTQGQQGHWLSPDVLEAAGETVIDEVATVGIGEWLKRVRQHHQGTYQHCMTVTGLAARYGRLLGFSQRDQRFLTEAALLHDIGKAFIPLAILDKPGRLDVNELKIIRTHTVEGHRYLEAHAHCDPMVLESVLSHHELLDGSGYPNGLSGGQIADLTRLITICDIYAAMIEQRPYKLPLTPAAAAAELEVMVADGKLDGALVRAFARLEAELA
jgi:putative nucleotidyltransferase with HDIG domain